MDKDAYKNAFNEAIEVCQEYCNEDGLCVTVDKTLFIYTDGFESGVKVGFINYPRFPQDEVTIKKRAIELAEKLMIKFEQYRVSVVFTDETIMLDNKEKIEKDGAE